MFESIQMEAPKPELEVSASGSSKPQPLLFVDAESLKSLSRARRRIISSHLQKAASPARSQRRATLLSTRRAEAARQRPVVFFPWRKASQSPEADERHDDDCVTDVSIVSEQPQDNATESDKTIVEYVSAHLSGTNPLSIIRKGNSDPFAAFAVPITPTVNFLLQFWRSNYVIGEVERSHNYMPGQAAFFERENNQVMTSLEEDCSAWIIMAYWTAVLKVVETGKVGVFARTQEGLRIHIQATSALRKKLATEPNLRSDATKWQLKVLYVTDIILGRMEAAKACATLLYSILRDEKNMSTNDMMRTSMFIYSDVSRACMTMTRPVVDTKVWCPTVSRTLRQRIFTELPALAQKYFATLKHTFHLDSSTFETNLSMYFSAHREFIVFATLPTNNYTSDSVLLTLWYGCVVMTASQICGTWLQLYLDMIEGNSPDVDEEDSAIAGARTYLAMAAICWSWTAHNPPSVKGNPIYDAAPVMIHHLKQALIRSERHQHDDGQKFANARLWVLFVGAMAERREQRLITISSSLSDVSSASRFSSQRFTAASTMSDVNTKAEHSFLSPSDGWFNRRLAKQASRMNLHSWALVQPVLAGFMFNPREQPHGSTWFSESLGKYLDSGITG